MKILLVQPPLNPNVVGAGIMYLSEPLALETVASCAHGQEILILDMRVENKLEETLKSFNPDIVGVTALTPDVYTAKNILQKVKRFNANALTVVGGHHATVMPNDFFSPEINLIVTGEGHTTFKEIVESFGKSADFSNVDGLFFRKDGAFMRTAERALEQNLDNLPFPDRNLTARYRNNYFRASWRPVVSVMSSRGCPHRCKFCSVWVHERGSYRKRSAGNILEELENIQEEYISFCDDNFLQDVDRAQELYELIKASGIRKKFKLIGRSDIIVKHPDLIKNWRLIGAELVLIGIESFRDSELKSFNKRNTVTNNEEAIRILHDNGISVVAQFIIDPEYAEKDFIELADYVKKMRLKHPIFSVLTPLPGTELYRERYNDLTTHNYEYYDFLHPVLPTKLPVEVFCRCLADLYRDVYTYAGDGPDSKNIVPQGIIESLYESILITGRTVSS